MRRIIAILLENEAGALSRVVGLFAQRNYNIETLTVAPTEDETLSRLTVTTRGDASKIEQITKQLNKLIEVVKVMDITDGDHVERELMLIKLRAEGTARAEIKRTTEIFRGQIIDVTDTTYTVQLTGPSGKLDSFIRAIDKAAVSEIAFPNADKAYRIITRQDVSALQTAPDKGGRIKGGLKITDNEKFWAASKFLILIEQ